jgi:hypothetical protein
MQARATDSITVRFGSTAELRSARHACWHLYTATTLAPYQNTALARLWTQLTTAGPHRRSIGLQPDEVDALASALATYRRNAQAQPLPGIGSVLRQVAHAQPWRLPDRGVLADVRDGFAHHANDRAFGFYVPMPDRATFETCLADTGHVGAFNGTLAAAHLGPLFADADDILFGVLTTPVVNIGFPLPDTSDNPPHVRRLAAAVNRVGALCGARPLFYDGSLHQLLGPGSSCSPRRVLLFWQ